MYSGRVWFFLYSSCVHRFNCILYGHYPFLIISVFKNIFIFFFRCVVDPETHIFSQGTHETRFVFSAFEFPQTHNSVYIFCNSTFCKTTDTSDMCTQICHGSPSLMGRSLWTLESEREKKSNYLNVFP